MLEWLKRQTPYILDILKLGMTGFALSLIVLLTTAVASLAACFILPVLLARLSWIITAEAEVLSMPFRVFFSAIMTLSVFACYVICVPFVVCVLACGVVIVPVAGIYLAVSGGWERIVSFLIEARNVANRVTTLLLYTEQVIEDIDQAIEAEEIAEAINAQQAHARNQINYNQSVHQISIEAGVADVLTNWKKVYSNLDSDAVLAKIKEYQEQLKTKEQNIKIAATIRFLDRVLSGGSDMTFAHNGASLRTIVLWGFSHMHVPANWLPGVTKEDVDNNFMESLYQIQRGYNLDDQGIDDGKRDNKTCFGGTINKLVYGMKAVLKGIEINYMSNATALLKLEALAKNQMKDYVCQQATDATEIIFGDIPEKDQEQLKENIKIDFSDEFEQMQESDRILTDFFATLPYLTLPITRDTSNASPSPNL